MTRPPDTCSTSAWVFLVARSRSQHEGAVRAFLWDVGMPHGPQGRHALGSAGLHPVPGHSATPTPHLSGTVVRLLYHFPLRLHPMGPESMAAAPAAGCHVGLSTGSRPACLACTCVHVRDFPVSRLNYWGGLQMDVPPSSRPRAPLCRMAAEGSWGWKWWRLVSRELGGAGTRGERLPPGRQTLPGFPQPFQETP